jgi:hypothetical protein
MDLRSILDVGERLFRVWMGTAWGKAALFLIAGGVLSVTSITQYVIPPVAKAFGVVITIPDTPIWLSLALILLGIAVLVLQRIVPEQTEQRPDANPHDVELLKSYRALMTPELIVFLTDHTFRLPFRRDILNPLERLADNWRGAHFEFLDEDLQRALSDVTGAARGLCNKVDNHIFNDRNNPAIGTPLTDMDMRYGIQEETREAIRHMDALAKGVVTTANTFERLARQKMPVG